MDEQAPLIQGSSPSAASAPPAYSQSDLNLKYPQYAAPPPPPHQQQQPQYGQPLPPGAVVYSAQPGAVMILPFGLRDQPAAMACPTCQAQIVTITTYEAGTLTFAICCGLTLVGCALGCCLIPFCMDGVKDVRHTCPRCNALVGVYHRM